MTTRHILVIALTMLVWVDRAPAPIVEEEKTTPAPAQSEAPKRKHSAKSTTESSSAGTRTKSPPTPQGPARFAGTWNGKVNQGLLGHIQSSVTVDANATSVALSHSLGGNTRPATINEKTITWKTGLAGEVTWTLTPNGDGQTAQVTMKGLMLNDTTTFRRGQSK